MNQQTFARMAERARGFVRDGALPCAVVAAAGSDRVAGVACYGAGGDEDPSLAGRSFLLASISKAITAVGIARLVDQGRLDYDDPVARYLPEFGTDEGRRRITLAHVLTHTTGLPGVGLGDYAGGQFAPEESYRTAFAGDLVYEAGTRMCYATHTFQLLNEVVFRVTGRRMGAFLKEYVFGPCDMPGTGFCPAPDARVPVASFPLPEPGGLERFMALELSGAGLWSTAGDLLRLGQALLRPGTLLRPETQARMLEPRPSVRWGDEGPTLRTLGWLREKHPRFPHQPETGYYHGGATGTLLWIDPARDLVFVFLSSIWCSSNDAAFATLEEAYAV